MSPRARDRALPLALGVLAFVIAIAQRPGWASSDTKIDLHVDPAGFLADVASAWSSTGDLGHVQGGQYGGYLFPMGPFFAALHGIGMSAWLTQRLWLGATLALAAWGAVRLMDELTGRPRGIAHAVAGLLVLLNPYVVVFSARTTVTLLGYAALPWLLVAVKRGIRADPTWWAAAFALIVTASGGGVNAAVTAWVLVGPLLLVVYERWIGEAGARAILRFAWRAALFTALVSAWWVVPLLVQSRFGVDFLRFTEQPGTIWSTTSLPESLRLMGYWISYLGVGYGGTLRPYFGDGGVMLFSLPVVIAGLLVPALALTGFAWTRRHPYGPFALLLVLAGLLIMSAGFPEGTPLRRASNFTYNHLVAVQFLRTTYKAGPLVVIGVAVLAGLAAQRVPRRALLAAALVLPVLASWPLIRGRGVDDQLLWKQIPAAWRDAAAQLDDDGGRAVVLPGQLYAYYDWGGTIDPILPVLTDEPVATRNAVGYADLRATDLLWTVDALVQQRRALPGQLDPLLDLLGARTVLQGADEDRTRSGATPPAEAADVLQQLGEPSAAYGPRRPSPRAAGTLGDPVELPQVRAWDRPGAPGLVRVEAPEPSVVVDGSAEGLAVGGTPLAGVAYAADLTPEQLRRTGRVVITDSNRRRVLVPSRLVQNAGPVLAADEEPSVDAAVLDPFGKGPDAQTVAVYGGGVEAVSAPSSPGYPQFPENRPFAALDGDPATHWQADRALTADRHVLTVTFDRPRDVPYVDLEPYDDSRAKVTAVEIAGRRHEIHAGENRLRLSLRAVASLSVRLIVAQEPGPTITAGIRELRIPGIHATEALRVPVIAERALRGANTPLTYVFQRTTGDDPFRRDPWHGASSSALVRDRADGERGLERVFSPPSARTWTLDGWATVAPDARDSALDALVGVHGGFESSARFQGRPEFRASSAFDGTPRPWLGSWQDGRSVWIEWAQDKPVSRLTLDPVPGVRRPTRVRVGEATVDVGAAGVVRLPAPVSGRVRLEILRSAFPPGTPGVERQRRAVGIAEIHGGPTVQVPRTGTLPRTCELTVTAGGRRVGLRVEGSVEDLDAGRPLRAAGCERLTLGAGRTRLSAPPGTFRPYVLRLRSGTPVTAAAPGRVVSPGTATRGGRKDIRLDLTEPARLVLAESFTRGRRASCDGRDLGAPEVGDAFGTAWRVPATCSDVTITFAPNRLVTAGYILSAVVALLLLVLLVAWRRRLEVWRLSCGIRESDNTPARMSVRRAALVSVVVGLTFAFVFAARAFPLFALGTFVVLHRGVTAKQLALAGGAVLGVAVPVLSLIIRPEDRGGYNPEYAIDRIAVHWVTVAGVALFVLALSRAMGRPARGRAAPPTGDAPRAPAP